jgi:hypothetical protein
MPQANNIIISEVPPLLINGSGTPVKGASAIIVEIFRMA